MSELRPHLSFFRSFPLSWLIFSLVFGAVAGFFFFALFTPGAKSEQLGLIVAFLVMLFASLACVYGFLQRKVDFVILHLEQSGQPMVYLHRRIPTEKHVQEFIDITKEHIQHTRHP